MERLYKLKSVKHNGRKGLRGSDFNNPKYKGLIGYKCLIDINLIKQYEPYSFKVLSPYYDSWHTSEILEVGTSFDFLEIETSNSIYFFERIKDE